MRIHLVLLLSLGLSACGGSDNGDTETSRGGGASTGNSACNRTSWIAGTTEFCNGRLVYRDYVYDDYGADNGLISPAPTILNLTTRGGGLGLPFATTPGLLSPTAGDIRYPAGLENTADLVKLELAIVGSELVATFELNTLLNADDAIAALAIDTDNNAQTGGGAWEGLGVSSSGWEVLQKFSSGDPATNLIVGRVPLPAGSVWRVQAVVAQKNGSVMNVAFRGVDEAGSADGAQHQVLPGSGNWWEDKQAGALAGGNISSFGEVVNMSDLRGGITRVATVPPGFHQRVYTSRYTLPPGEGVSLAGVPGRHGDTGTPCEQYFHYLGKYQPFGIYIPDQAGPHGAQVIMHGCEANHGSQINQANFQQRFGADLNRILIAPLGRGPYGYFSDISERDVLDTLADVRANYTVDDEQIFSSGYSMGGYGAMRTAALYPDVFAGAVNWVGFSGNVFNVPLPGGLPLPVAPTGGIGNVIDFLGNLRHIPIVNLYSGADELVHVTTALALMQRFGEVEVPYEFFLHPVAEHLSYLIFDDWQKEADYTRDLRRVRNPARVTYRTDASFDYPEYAIKHDRAYWVSEIVAAGAGYSDVDLTSLGCGGAAPSYVTGQNVGADPVPWVATLRTRGEGQTAVAQATLSGTLRNISSLHVDTTAACLAGKAVHYTLNSDVPVALRFSDGRRLNLPAGNQEGNF